jgi:hypothetical protein
VAEPLEAVLELDTSAAERAVADLRRELEDQLQSAVDSFGDAYRTTATSLPPVEAEVDADAVTEGITTAVTAADSTVTPDAETEQLTLGIEGAVSSADGSVATTADEGAITEGIETAVSSADAEVKIEADLSDVEAQLEGIANIDISSVGGGFSAADEQAQELSDTLEDLSEGSEETGDALGKTSNVSTTLATVFSAAKGDGRALLGTLKALPSGFGPVAAGAGAVVLAFSAMEQAGARSIAATERLQTVLGKAAEGIETIDVGGLSGDLGELAVQAGVSGGALRNAAANAAQMGISSGATKREVVDFANNVNALALRATALNPQLGEAGAVAERLNTVLGRGGRFLNRYGIDMTAAEITTRALQQTGKDTARELTSFERSTAGASIAVEKLGDKMGTDFTKGTQQMSVRIKSIKAELSSAFASAGKPLVEPTIEAMESLSEVATELSTILGELGSAGIPLLVAGFKAVGLLAKPLQLLAEAVNAIPAPILTAGIAFVALRAAMGPLSGLALSGAAGLERLGFSAATLNGPLLASSERVLSFGGAIQANAGHLAGLAAGLLVAASSFDQMGESVVGTVTGIAGFTLAGSQIGAMFGNPALGAGIGAAAGGIVTLGKAMFDTTSETEKMDEAVKRLNSSLVGMGNRAAVNAFLEDFNKNLDIATLAMADSSDAIDILDQAFNGSGDAADAAGAQVDKMARIIEKLAKENPARAERVVQGFRDMGDAVPTKAIAQFEEAQNKGADTHKRHAKNVKEDADANRELTGDLDGATSAARTQIDVFNQLSEATGPITAKIQALGSAMESEVSGKVPTATQAFDDLISSVREFTDNPLAAPDFGGYVEALDGTVTDTQTWLNTVQFLMDSGLTGIAGLVLQRGPEMTKGLIDSLRNSGPEQQAAWNTSLEQGFAATAAAPGRAEGIGQEIARKLAEGVKVNPQQFIDALNANVAGIETWGATITDLAARGLGSLAALVKSQGPIIGGQLAKSLNEATPDQLIAWNNSIAIGQDRLNVANNVVAAGTAAIAQTYKDGVNFIPTSADEAMLQAQANIANSIPGQGAAAGSAGTTVNTSYDTGLTSNGGPAGATSSAMGGVSGTLSAAGSILGTPAQQAGQVIGSQFGSGVNLGINFWRGRIAQSAAELVQLAFRVMVSVSQSASPSKLFAEIGKDMTAGVAVGMGDTDAERAVVREAESIIHLAAASAAPEPPMHLQRRSINTTTMNAENRVAIEFNISVAGVTDPGLARTVGAQIGDAAAAALARRGVVVAARTGGS